MAKQEVKNQKNDESIPIITLPKRGSRSIGGFNSTFLIVAILLAEAISAYTVVALNYSAIHDWVYGYPPGLGVMFEISEITVNPAETNGQRFLLVSIGLQLRTQTDITRIERKEAIVKDAIISLLSKRTVQDLAQVDTRDDLKQEIGLTINQIVGEPAVRNLFFTQFVMQ